MEPGHPCPERINESPPESFPIPSLPVLAASHDDIVRKGLEIAAEICVYTNANITVLEPS